jgi:hypothetical protein
MDRELFERFRLYIAHRIYCSDGDESDQDICEPKDENIPWSEEMDSPAQKVKSHLYKTKTSASADPEKAE